MKYLSNKRKSDTNFAFNSTLFKEYKEELSEINKLKWLESEKAGLDIGFNQALLIWIRKHRDEWQNNYRTQQKKLTYLLIRKKI